ncbi:MAG: hypothetical protein RLY89_2409 [Bacteroidota bacterium]|jgi:hypothetical protein
MRIDPTENYDADLKAQRDARMVDLTRKAAITLSLAVELAIFYKMLAP